MMRDRSAFLRVLEIAKKTVGALDYKIAELEKLKSQRETWDQLACLIRAILDGDVPLGFDDLLPMFPAIDCAKVLNAPRDEPEFRQDRLWKSVQLVMQINKRPMTADEILQEVL